MSAPANATAANTNGVKNLSMHVPSPAIVDDAASRLSVMVANVAQLINALRR